MGASQHTLSATTRVKASPLRWLVVASVFVLAFITIVDRVCISAAKRDIAAELRINDVQFGWVFGAFTLGYAVLMIPGGWLADRFGPRRCLTCIVCLWSAFTMASGAMRALIPLIAVRFLFGLAEAGAYPTASRALYAWMPARERGLALGLLNAGSRVGAALGLPLASYLILGFGWRACFLTLGALGFIWASGWFFWFRDRPAHQSATYSEATPATASGISVIFSQPGALLLFQYFADNFTLFLVYSWMLPYLEQHFHLDPVRAGIYAGLPMYCGAVATWTGGLLVDALYRRGYGVVSRTLPAVLGFIIAGLSVAGAAFAGGAGWFVALFGCAVFGLDFTVSASWTVCADIGRENTGAVSAAMNMAGSVGSFACSIGFPYLFTLTHSAQPFFVIAALLNFLAAASWVLLRRSLARTLA